MKDRQAGKKPPSRHDPSLGPLTVDVDELQLYLNGVIFDFRFGSGIAVNDVEIEAALAAIERKEIVLCRRGQRLTGTKIVLRKKTFVEVQA